MRSHSGRGPRASFFSSSLLLGWLCAACSGVDYDLRAASELYRDARYEAVQAWIAELRRDYRDMDPAQRTRFHYLNGMTAYRLVQPEEALHELALAAHAARDQPKTLSTRQLALLYRTLEELASNRAHAREMSP